MNWFKMFTEARNDAKLRSLTDAQHRTWFRLLCYAAEQDHRGRIGPVPASIVALEVADGDAVLLEETCNALQALQCVTWSKCNAGGVEIEFCSFTRRQMRKPSDDPERIRERVSKCRSKTKPQKKVASNGQHDDAACNAPVTRYKRDVTRVTPIEEIREEKNTPLPPSGDEVVDFGRITMKDRFDLEAIGEKLAGWRAAKFPDAWICDAILVANCNATLNQTASYINTCLRRWKARGGPDPEEVGKARAAPTPDYVPSVDDPASVYGPKWKPPANGKHP